MLKFILVIHGLILIFADGSGKAGLTFEATNNALALQRINATNTHAGGWEKSELRGRLNTGDLWSLLPCELQSKVKSVTKMTDNLGGGKAGTPSATTDKVFLLSMTEVYGDLQSDGAQYEYYATSMYSGPEIVCYFSTRSVSLGRWSSGSANSAGNVFPAWCF